MTYKGWYAIKPTKPNQTKPKLVRLCLKIDLVPHPARAEGLGKYIYAFLVTSIENSENFFGLVSLFNGISTFVGYFI